jgi:exodeoxyribonuclease-5
MKKEILDFLLFHTPTTEQKTALEALSVFVKENNEDDFFILSGAAGTGKTSITSALIGYLNDNEVAFKIAAPTGRAARILGKKSQTISSTIHSLIYNAEINKETGVVRWKLKQNKSKDFTIFIIDESSMINAEFNGDGMFQSDNSLLSNLIKYIRSGNKKNKVLFLGDRNQLPPYEEVESLALDPNHYRKSFNWKGSFHYLTEVKRVEDGSYILKNATNLRMSIDENIALPNLEGNRIKNVWEAAKEFAREFNPDLLDQSVAIGRSNKANRMFNDEVRKKLFGTQNKLIENGDLLIVLQNWKRSDNVLFNGDHVLVEEVDFSQKHNVCGLDFVPIKLKAQKLDGSILIIEDLIYLETLTAENGKIPLEAENQLRAERFRKNKIFSNSGNSEDDQFVGALRLGYGYAITCQKAQGGEWDKVYINTFGIKDKKWLYTAVTRAKSDLNIY